MKKSLFLRFSNYIAHVAGTPLDIEELSEDELKKMRKTYEQIASSARKSLKEGKVDTGIPSLHPGIKKKSKFPA